MLSYIQLSKEFTFLLEDGEPITLEADTILSVHHRNLGKRYYTNEFETLHVSYMDIKFKITKECDYMWLPPNESMLYQQSVTIVEKFYLFPIKAQLDRNSVHLVSATTPIKVGTVVHVDGFAYDTNSSRYIPYTKYRGIKFELEWDKFILTFAFESLFKQSRISCLPLGKQNLLI